MKTKVFAWLAVLAVIVAAGVYAPASVATSNAVQVPEALRLAIGGLILAAVTLGLQAVFDTVGLDLRGVGAVVAVALSGFAVAQLQGLIDLVPVAYDQAAMIVLNILVVILSGVGVLRGLLNPNRAAAMLQ